MAIGLSPSELPIFKMKFEPRSLGSRWNGRGRRGGRKDGRSFEGSGEGGRVGHFSLHLRGEGEALI